MEEHLDDPDRLKASLLPISEYSVLTPKPFSVLVHGRVKKVIQPQELLVLAVAGVFPRATRIGLLIRVVRGTMDNTRTGTNSQD